MKTNQTTYKIVRYNNKSRQGTYLRISSIINGKRKTGTYKYSFKPLEIDALKNYYHDKYHKKKTVPTPQHYKKNYQAQAQGQTTKKRTPTTRQAEQYLAKIKKQPQLMKEIRAGVTAATIKNAITATNTEINKAKEQTLRPLIADKDIRKLMIQKTNYDKLQARLEYRATAYDKNGKEIWTTKNAIKTPEKAIQELKETAERWNNGEYPNNYGWKLTRLQGDKHPNTTRIKLTMIIRKGQTTI